MPPEFQAEFTPTRQDLADGAQMRDGMSCNPFTLYIAGGVSAIVVFGIAGYHLSFPMLAWMGVFVAGGMMLMPLAERYFQNRAANKLKAQAVSVALDDAGLHISLGTESHLYGWEHLTKVRLDDRGVLIHIGDHDAQFIPARAWVDGYRQADIKAFCFARLRPSNRT